MADVAEGAQFAAIAVAFAQQAGGGIATAVAETSGKWTAITLKSSRSSAMVSGRPSGASQTPSGAVFAFARDQAAFPAPARRRAAPAAGRRAGERDSPARRCRRVDDFPVVFLQATFLDDFRLSELAICNSALIDVGGLVCGVAKGFDAEAVDGVDEAFVGMRRSEIGRDQALDHVGHFAAAKARPITCRCAASLPWRPPSVIWYHSSPFLSTPRMPMWPR